MQQQESRGFDALLSRARRSDAEARQQLLEAYRNYLLILSNVRRDQTLRSKIDDSDIVQETLIQADRDFPQFRGQCEAELIGWLRAILANKKALIARRYYGRACRDPRMERQLQQELDQSSLQMDRAFVSSNTSPSRSAARREMAVLLADALAKLPDHYRQVVLLYHVEGRKMREVADTMQRSVDSVKKLWARAMVQLREYLKEHG